MRGQISQYKIIFLFTAMLGLVFAGTGFQQAEALVPSLGFQMLNGGCTLEGTDKDGAQYKINGVEGGLAIAQGEIFTVSAGLFTKHAGQNALDT